MNFFYDLIYKFRKYIILGISLILLFLINDFLLCLIINGKKTVSYNKRETSMQPALSLNNEEKLNEDTFKVDVKGEVKKPGVYEVTASMNVLDAINIAGGVTKKGSTENINLSKKLKDQMVVIVPKKTQSTSTCSCESISKNTSLSASESNTLDDGSSIVHNDALIISSTLSSINDDIKLVSLNDASIDELKTIPGIGESKAQSIIEYRETNRFNTIEDIKNVSGIGDSLFEKIKDYICI